MEREVQTLINVQPNRLEKHFSRENGLDDYLNSFKTLEEGDSKVLYVLFSVSFRDFENISCHRYIVTQKL